MLSWNTFSEPKTAHAPSPESRMRIWTMTENYIYYPLALEMFIWRTRMAALNHGDLPSLERRKYQTSKEKVRVVGPNTPPDNIGYCHLPCFPIQDTMIRPSCGCRTWRNQVGTDQKVPFLLHSYHSSRRYNIVCQGKVHQKPHSALNPWSTIMVSVAKYAHRYNSGTNVTG